LRYLEMEANHEIFSRTQNPVYKYRDRTYSRLRLSCLLLINSLSPDLS
jgi:hypothetical protein